jgi:uncharacterized protein (TIGR02246 family)
MDLGELAARESIRDTIARYAHAADTGKFDALAECFAEDGVLEIAGGPSLVGRAAIREYLGGVGRDLAAETTVPYVRHQVSSTLIELTGPASATARSYFFVITERGPDHWGRYRDTFVSHEGRWLLAHRRALTDGSTPGSWASGR